MNDIERMERFLESRLLQRVSREIEDLGSEVVGASKVRVFRLHSRGLVASGNEIVLLERSELENDIGSVGIPASISASLGKLKERYNSETFWYVASQLGPIIKAESNSFVLYAGGPSAFSERLIAVPGTFRASVAAEIDVDSAGFTVGYVPRLAAFVKTKRNAAVAEWTAPMELDAELRRWADSDKAERPLLVLGDRGSGKTWQLVKFCEQQYDRSRSSPWSHPPALYVSLRGAAEFLFDTERASLGLYGLLAERYLWFRMNWSVSAFLALLERQQVIVCLDGLDEIELQPSDAGVRDHLRRLLAMIPRAARLLVSARTTHFASLHKLYSLETWPGADVASSFRIGRLMPFTHENIVSYAATYGSSEASDDLRTRLRELYSVTGGGRPTREALRRCIRRPALASRALDELRRAPSISDSQLLGRRLEGSLIEFNVQVERTRPVLRDTKGEVHPFGTDARISFLGELAWFMAERCLDKIDLDRLPQRIMRMFGLDSEGLERDIRSQTV